MTSVSDRVSSRNRGRRADDNPGSNGQPRERRRPAAQSKAAAESIILANLAAATKDRPITETSGSAYRNSRNFFSGASEGDQTKATPEAKKRASPPPQPKTGWTFERRKKQIPRSFDIEDADIL